MYFWTGEDGVSSVLRSLDECLSFSFSFDDADDDDGDADLWALPDFNGWSCLNLIFFPFFFSLELENL